MSAESLFRLHDVRSFRVGFARDCKVCGCFFDPDAGSDQGIDIFYGRVEVRLICGDDETLWIALGRSPVDAIVEFLRDSASGERVGALRLLYFRLGTL